ncbi:endoglucanase protein [Halorhabdus tiamatea SARL4B]|nr:cellulase family glycosylhydrolase [Halorhabdus tiamatea]ERJ07712.1 endoglucanase protein [Halorhabdus tiamatea SARL4B]
MNEQPQSIHERDSETERTRPTTSRRRFLQAAAGAGIVVASGGVVGHAAADSHTNTLPSLRRNGNLIETPDGETVELHGVNIADPKRVDVTASVRGKDAVQTIDLATDGSRGWHADVVRLPVQPVDIGEHEAGTGPEPPAFDESQLQSYLEDHLDPAVERCGENGAYAIIDYHRHRDIPWTNAALGEEVQLFWDIVAARYGEMNHVIFEVYNEPQGNPNYGVSGQELVDFWSEWKSTAQPWVDTIREYSKNLVLVGSPRWSQMTFGAVIEEFDGDNLGYTLHLYPAHGPTTPADYDDFVTPPNDGGGAVPYDDETPAWEVTPVFMTEWGFDYDAGPAAGGGVNEETAAGADWAEYDPDYGHHVTEWLSTRPVHSTAWEFDVLWDPSMFTRGFDVPDDESWSPYTDGSIPEYVTDRPAEWELQTGGGYMGDTVKQFLRRDPDNDGRIEDVTGDGETTIGDVRRLLNNRDSEGVQTHAHAYDFNGDGTVNAGDVLALFREIY